MCDPITVADSLASGFFLGGILTLTALGLSLVLGVMGIVTSPTASS